MQRQETDEDIWKPPAESDRPMFVVKYCRAIVESRVAATISPAGVLLCIIVALEQDRIRFGRTVNLWNGQLQQKLSIAKGDTLRRIRSLVEQEGWLWYRNDGPRRPGLYGVQIPPLHLLSGCNGGESHPPQGCIQNGLHPQPRPTNGCNEGVLHPRLHPLNGSPPTLTLNNTPSPQNGGGDENVISWEGVEAAIRLFGVLEEGIVDEPRRKGCTPEDIMELVEIAERDRHSGRWDDPPAALNMRLKAATPGLLPEDGWVGKKSKASRPVVPYDPLEHERESQLLSMSEEAFSELIREVIPADQQANALRFANDCFRERLPPQFKVPLIFCMRSRVST